MVGDLYRQNAVQVSFFAKYLVVSWIFIYFATKIFNNSIKK